MGKKEFFAKQEQNDSGKLLLGANDEEKAKAKLMPTRCSTVDDWKQVLEKNLKFPSTLPSVIKGDFQDAQELFKPGKNGQVEAEVTLRRKSTFFQRFTWQKGKPVPDEIVLPQFDPNLRSNAVVCRHPTCKNKNPDAPKRSTCVKRDLYLCPTHRERLKSHICEAMAKEEIEFHEGEFASEPGRFDGYTSLISLFDGASRHSKNQTVKEAALNTRNFLIITSTLLNPDDENLSVVLPPVAAVTSRIVSQEGSTASDASVRRRSASGGERAASPPGSSSTDRIERTFREIIGDSARVENLLSLLRGIIHIILLSFGVLYTWIVPSNAGGKIGAGVGGFIGFALAGPAGKVFGVFAGAACGGLIGSGLYQLHRNTRDQQREDIVTQEWRDVGQDGGDPNEGEQPQGIYRCNFNDNIWGELRMYIELVTKWISELP